jgi:hypothetical protein
MRKLVGLLIVALTAACNSGDSTGPGNATLPGNYPLQTANAKAVPTVAIQDQSGTYEVLRGRVVLRADNTFVDSLLYRFTPPGGVAQAGTDVRIGTYVQAGDNVTLTFQTGGGSFVNYSITWINGNTLAYAEEGLSLIYRK